jgi:hypothetical protein
MDNRRWGHLRSWLDLEELRKAESRESHGRTKSTASLQGIHGAIEYWERQVHSLHTKAQNRFSVEEDGVKMITPTTGDIRHHREPTRT